MKAESPTPETEEQMTPLELVGFVVTLGLCAAMAYVAADLFLGNVHLSPFDVIIATGLASCVAIPVVIVVAVLMRIVFLCMWMRPTRLQWIAALPIAISAILLGFICSILLEPLKDWVRLIFLTICVPLMSFAVMFSFRRPWILKPDRAVLANLLTFQFLLLLALAALADPSPAAVFLSPSIGFLVTFLAAVGFVVWMLASMDARPRKATVGVAVMFLGMCGFAGLPAAADFAGISGRTASVSAGQTEEPKVQAATDAPNVVLIVLDTTRRDHLGCYGDMRGLTPALDAFASGGVVFEDAFSQAPWTVPSHASIFTGLYPVTHGCSNEHHLWLDDEFVTLAERLRDNGYQTVSLNSNVYLPQCNLLQGFDKSILLRGPYDDSTVHQIALAMGRPERWVDKGAAEGVNELKHWLSREYDKTAPFFLFVNLCEAHVKYLPPSTERRAHLPAGASLVSAAVTGFDYRPTRMHIRGAENPPQKETLRALYAAEVQYQDRRLGEILDNLRNNIDLDHTLVIITADHGENLGEGGRWEHLYAINDLLIHVPLIIRYPKDFPVDTRQKGLCELVDIVPTVLSEIPGMVLPIDIQGKLLQPDKFTAKQAVIAQMSPYYLYLNKVEPIRGFQSGLSDFLVSQRVWRTDRLKFVWSSDGKNELFDVSADPIETQNLADHMSEDSAKLLASLESRWASLPHYQPKPREKGAATPVEDHSLQQLRSLGYVGN